MDMNISSLEQCFTKLSRHDMIKPSSITPTHWKYSEPKKVAGKYRRCKLYYTLNKTEFTITMEDSLQFSMYKQLEIEDAISVRDELQYRHDNDDDMVSFEEIIVSEEFNGDVEYSTESGEQESTSIIIHRSVGNKLLVYPVVEHPQTITGIKFISDPKYNINHLKLEIGRIDNIDNLLQRIKKCMIFVLDEAIWYTWNGKVIEKFKKGQLTWVTGVSVKVCASKSPEGRDYVHKRISLLEMMGDIYNMYEFHVETYKDVENKRPKIPLSHAFIIDIVSKGSRLPLPIDKNLLKKYNEWKIIKCHMSHTSKLIKAQISCDDVLTSEDLVATFRKIEDVIPGDVVCVKRYGTDKLAVHMI